MVKVTTKEIYEKLMAIENLVIKINGRVSLNRWIATTALTLSILLLGFLLSQL